MRYLPVIGCRRQYPEHCTTSNDAELVLDDSAALDGCSSCAPFTDGLLSARLNMGFQYETLNSVRHSARCRNYEIGDARKLSQIPRCDAVSSLSPQATIGAKYRVLRRSGMQDSKQNSRRAASMSITGAGTSECQLLSGPKTGGSPNRHLRWDSHRRKSCFTQVGIKPLQTTEILWVTS